MANVPLLLISLAIYNIVGVLIGQPLEAEALRLPLMGGEYWVVKAADLLVGGSILLLLGEVMRNSRAPGRPMMAHFLSLMVLAGAICEFVLWPKFFGNSTFFLLILLMAADFFGGIAQRERSTAAPAKRQAPAPAPAPAPVEPQTMAQPVQQSAPQSAPGGGIEDSAIMRPHRVEPQISARSALSGGAAIQSEGATVQIEEKPEPPGPA